jgi:hypothetical protein
MSEARLAEASGNAGSEEDGTGVRPMPTAGPRADGVDATQVWTAWLPRRFAGVLLAFAILHVLLYSPTAFQAVFLGDDWLHIERVPRERLPLLFIGDWHQGYRGGGGFYRPLPRIFMQAGREIFDLRPSPYLLVSAAFHILNCALLWLLVVRLTRRAPAAWIAALVFALFPTHPEAVLQVSTLADPMAVTGVLTAMVGLADVRNGRRRRGWITAAGGMLLGILSKESWVTLPMLALLLELIWPERRDFRAACLRVAVVAGVAIAYILFRQAILGGVGGYGMPLNYAVIRGTYDGVFRVLMWPFGSLAKWHDLLNAVTLPGLLIIAWACVGFPRLMLFGLGWMLCATLPIVGFVPDLYGGRLLYIVAVGWALVLGGFFDAALALAPTEPARRRAAIALAVAMLVPYAITQQVYCRDWRRSFEENDRFLKRMAEVARAEGPDGRFAILKWPNLCGVAGSNRPETAALALSILTGIDPKRIEPQRTDALLAPDVPVGAIVFAVERDWQLRMGRVRHVEGWQWLGEQLGQWEASDAVTPLHIRSDGADQRRGPTVKEGADERSSPTVKEGADERSSPTVKEGGRQYEFHDSGGGLFSPQLAGQAGFYSVLVIRYREGERELDPRGGQIVYWPEGDSLDFERPKPLARIPRIGKNAWLANLGWLPGLNQVVYMPCLNARRESIYMIQIACFEIEGLGPS